MPDDLSLRRLRGMIAMRRAAMEIDDQWSSYDGKQADEAFSNLEEVQNDLLKMDFSHPHARALAVEMLLDGSDDPNFSDDFKNKLFDLLRHSRT